MDDSKRYYVPQYYKDFSCKGKDCRNCCCHGWNISLSMQEYFNLLGLECSKDLREKLDTAFHLAKVRSEEHYAQISPKWTGDCPLHMENGYCQLQYECGEDALPMICRYYPRSPRTLFRNECCISNSCEKVIEMLIESDDKLTLEERELSFKFDDDEEKGNMPDKYFEIREFCLQMLQNRNLPLEKRIIKICLFLEEIDKKENDILKIIELYRQDSFNNNLLNKEILGKNVFIVQHTLLNWFHENSPSINEYCKKTIDNLEIELDKYDKSLKIYTNRLAKIKAKFSNLETIFEKVIANNFFFEKIPFSDRHEVLKDESIGIFALYTLIKILVVGCIDNNSTQENLVDLIASYFRLVEHTNFYKNCAIILDDMDFDTIEKIMN